MELTPFLFLGYEIIQQKFTDQWNLEWYGSFRSSGLCLFIYSITDNNFQKAIRLSDFICTFVMTFT